MQKSSEVLSIFKAPFWRKANNASTSTTKNTTNNDQNKSASASSRTSAVNYNDDSVSVCDTSDASNSNIYTEIDLPNSLATNGLNTNSNNSLSSTIFSCLLDGNYANKSTILQTESNGVNTDQNLYDIDSSTSNVNDILQKENDSLNPVNNINCSLKLNLFFSSSNKSMTCQFQSILPNGKNEQNDSTFMGMSNTEKTVNELDINPEADTKDFEFKLSLTKRLKSRFKTSLNFFKGTKVGLVDYNN